MSGDSLTCTVDNGHARITLNRPDAHNPIDGDLIGRLSDALERLASDSALRVVTIRGAGPSFCAGADLKFILAVLDDAPALAAYIRSVKDTFTRLERFPCPVIAVVHGFALAGGLELMLACDLALAAEDAVLGDQHINFGLLPGGGASQRLPALLGLRKAKELMFMGSRVSGAEAERLGLVNKAVPREDLAQTAEEWAGALREKTPDGLRHMKTLIHSSRDVPLAEGLDLEESVFLDYARHDDVREGLLAFKEKRKPQY